MAFCSSQIFSGLLVGKLEALVHSESCHRSKQLRVFSDELLGLQWDIHWQYLCIWEWGLHRGESQRRDKGLSKSTFNTDLLV